MTYLLTFRSYGTWLHGDERGSVDRAHNVPGTDLLEPHRARQKSSARRMNSAMMVFNENQCAVVEQAIEGVAEFREWTIHALAVRVNHVHIVVSAPVPPSALLHDFKSWSTRRLRENGLVEKNQEVWARHGSTRYLNTEQSIKAAIHYVMEGQGDVLDP